MNGLNKKKDTEFENNDDQLKMRFKVNSNNKSFADMNFLLDFPCIKFLIPKPEFFRTKDTYLEKNLESDGSWSFMVTQTFDLSPEQQKYNYEFFLENLKELQLDEIGVFFFGKDVLPFRAVPMRILTFEIFTVKDGKELCVDFTDKITQNCKDTLTLKAQERVKEILRNMIRSEDCLLYGEAFMRTLDNLINEDDEKRDVAGYYALNGILGESFDDFLVSICGWKLKSIMMKALLIYDMESQFHDEICNATFLSEWDDGFLLEQPCKVNTKTFEVIDIVYDFDVLDKLEELQGEWVVIDGVKHPVFSKDEGEGQPYPVFWYGDNV